MLDGNTIFKLMDKATILRWVARHMPVEVDGKTYYVHAGALIDPDHDEFLWVFDKDPYEQDDISKLEPVTIKPVENKKVILIM